MNLTNSFERDLIFFSYKKNNCAKSNMILDKVTKGIACNDR